MNSRCSSINLVLKRHWLFFKEKKRNSGKRWKYITERTVLFWDAFRQSRTKVYFRSLFPVQTVSLCWGGMFVGKITHCCHPICLQSFHPISHRAWTSKCLCMSKYFSIRHGSIAKLNSWIVAHEWNGCKNGWLDNIFLPRKEWRKYYVVIARFI